MTITHSEPTTADSVHDRHTTPVPAGDLTGTFDPDPRVVGDLADGDKRARRTKGRSVDTIALAYRIYPRPDGVPVIRIASHAERPFIPGLTLAGQAG